MSRLTLPPNSPRTVRVTIDPSRPALTASATMPDVSTESRASRGLSVHLCPAALTVTGRFRRAISSCWTFVRAAASRRPPTLTPSTFTPLAIRSRREWSYRYMPATSTARTPTLTAATIGTELRRPTGDALTLVLIAASLQGSRSFESTPRRGEAGQFATGVPRARPGR